MNQDELTCAASGFAISGFGSPYMFKYLETIILEQISTFSIQNIKETVRAFIITKRGSKQLYQVMMPRIQQISDSFTTRELCYIMYGYWKSGFAPKPFIADLEIKIGRELRDIENVELEVVQLITQVFCRSRVGSRDFHKLLETCILTRLQDIKRKPKMLHAIGLEFEQSGLCSLDTLKILKKTMFQLEVEQDTFGTAA